ncbi:MAG: AtzE family amidohydrolase, partial [Cyanobacteria bacterium J06628_3]
MNLDSADAVSIATAVKQGQIKAVEVTKAALDRIAARDKQLNCFTKVTA